MTNKLLNKKLKKPKAKPRAKPNKKHPSKQKQKQKQNQNVRVNISGGGSQGTSIIQVPQYIEVPKYINQNSTQDSTLVNQLVDEIRNFGKIITTKKQPETNQEIDKPIEEINKPIIKKRTRGPNKPKIYGVAVQEQIQNAVREQNNAFNVSDPNEQGERIQSLYKEKGDFKGVNPSKKKISENLKDNPFLQKDFQAQAKQYAEKLTKQKKEYKKLTKKQEIMNMMGEDNNITKLQYQQEQKTNNEIMNMMGEDIDSYINRI
jgi:hypothetical protein